jgi:N-acetylmuramidase
MSKSLKPQDFQDAAALLSVDVPTIMAVAEVESAGSGFFIDGQPKILFEAHVFSRRTNGIFDSRYPNLSSPTWNKDLYLGGSKEHLRLAEAVKLNRNAALESASWGMFQIMGFNYARCGFDIVQNFVNAMYESEAAQLKAFCRFVKSSGLDDELQRGDLLAFALGYNGPRQAENHYADKLYAAKTRFISAQDPTRRLV